MRLRTQKEDRESRVRYLTVELVYCMITAGFEKLLTLIYNAVCAGSGGLRLGGPGAESEPDSASRIAQIKDLESIWLRKGWDTDA